jgi:hypothetical protein
MTGTNQEIFRLLLPGKIAALVEKRGKERGCSSKEAVAAFYRSSLYRGLEQEQTKRWRENPARLYRGWKD